MAYMLLYGILYADPEYHVYLTDESSFGSENLEIQVQTINISPQSSKN